MTVALLTGVASSGSAAQESAPSEPELVKEVTTVVQCFCGGCSNQTLHDCTCGRAAQERDKIAAAISGGASPEEIIAGYVEVHGAQVRIVPEMKGLDRIGFAIPFAGSIAALLALVIVLLVWKRRPHLRPAVVPPIGSDQSDARYLDRLKSELKELD